MQRAKAGEIISIHAAREGGDNWCGIKDDDALISIHAAREGGDINVKDVIIEPVISIHAAREGGDAFTTENGLYSLIISIHAAREGGDEELLNSLKVFIDFNPRRP